MFSFSPSLSLKRKKIQLSNCSQLPETSKMVEVEQKKKQIVFRFTYHGVDLNQLLAMSYEQLMSWTDPTCGSTGAGLPTQAPEKGHEGGATHGEVPGGEELPEKHDHPAWDGRQDYRLVWRQDGGHVWRQDLQAWRNQAKDEFSITYTPVKHSWPGTSATYSSCFTPPRNHGTKTHV